MRISDWSSDVCSSDLLDRPHLAPPAAAKVGAAVVDQADQGAAAERRQGGEVAIAGGGLPDGAGEGAGHEDLPGGREGDMQVAEGRAGCRAARLAEVRTQRRHLRRREDAAQVGFEVVSLLEAQAVADADGDHAGPPGAARSEGARGGNK